MKTLVDLSALSPEMVENFKILCRAWGVGLTVELEDETAPTASLNDLIDMRLRRTFVHRGQKMIVLAADSFNEGEFYICAPDDNPFEFGKQQLFQCQDGIWAEVDDADRQALMVRGWYEDYEEERYRQV